MDSYHIQLCFFILFIKSSLNFTLARTLVKLNSLPSDDYGPWLQKNSQGVKLAKIDSSEAFHQKTCDDEDERPVIVLKNYSNAIPFTKVDATLITLEDSKEDQEGLGPALSLDYDSEFPSESDLSSSLQNHFSNEHYSGNEGDLKVDISDVNPVYVKPPSGFKPIIYPNRMVDGVRASVKSSITLKPATVIEKVYPHPYPYGLSSWILGGIRGIERTGFWESLGSDGALGLSQPEIAGKPVAVTEWIDLSTKKLATEEDEKNEEMLSSRNQPPDRSSPESLRPSFFEEDKYEATLEWQMPSLVVEKLQFVPLLREKEKIKTSSPLIAIDDASSSLSYWMLPASSSREDVLPEN